MTNNMKKFFNLFYSNIVPWARIGVTLGSRAELRYPVGN
jgi:hypothetical protein